MKTKLIILSLSPLCLLTFIKNFKFICKTDEGQILNRIQFIETNLLVLIFLSGCFLWCIISFFIYFHFKFFVSFGGKGGYTIKEIKEDKEAGLDFFLTFILPLLIGDLNEWQNMFAFIVYFIIIIILLIKTDLFYKNPILTLLGYHVYKLLFSDNPKIKEGCIILTSVIITDADTIEYKEIADNVLYAKVLKRR